MDNDNIGFLTATVTPDMEKLMRDTFNLEVEMLQGERTVLPDGMIEYKLQIADPQKCEMIKEFCLKVISKSHKQNGN